MKREVRAMRNKKKKKKTFWQEERNSVTMVAINLKQLRNSS